MKLRLNSPAQIQRRRDRDDLLDLIKTLNMQLIEAEEKVSRCNLPQEKNRQIEFHSIIEDLKRKLDVLKRQINGAVD